MGSSASKPQQNATTGSSDVKKDDVQGQGQGQGQGQQSQPPAAKQQQPQDARVKFPAAKQLPWKPSRIAKVYTFTHLGSGDKASWRLGHVSPEAFVSTINDTNAKFISGDRVTIYFQTSPTTCARRQFRHSSGFTLARLISDIHSTAISAAVMTIKTQIGKTSPVLSSQVRVYLANKSVSNIYVTSNQIYVKVNTTSTLRRKTSTGKV